MRVLLLGGFGMLGSEVFDLLPSAARPTAIDFDVTNPEHVATVAVEKYDVVVNCAAYTAVDKAEEEPDAAFSVNALGPGLLARACAMAGTTLIHVSTDYVFDGEADTPYVESSHTRPRSAYGESKLAGEEGIRASGAPHWILRTSWLFGPTGPCFPRSIVRRALDGGSLRVVADQVGCPTSTRLVAQAISRLLEAKPEFGTYHVCGEEAMSWHSLALRVLGVAGIGAEVEPISTEEWPTAARRPKYSVLDCTKARTAGIYPEAALDDELRRCLPAWR